MGIPSPSLRIPIKKPPRLGRLPQQLARLATTGKLAVDCPAQDIGEERAKGIAKEAILRLADKGVVQAGHYDRNDSSSSHHRRDIYAGDEKAPSSCIVEYRFRFLRKLNGIPVVNNGILIGIAPHGELSSLRLGGVQFDSVNGDAGEAPAASGTIVQRKLTNLAVKSRVDAHMSATDGVPIWAKVMYFMPGNVDEAVIEPMFVSRFSRQVQSGRRTIPMPAKVMGYSLTDPAAPASDITEL